ncbi:hypothetical protein I6M70_13885 [Acinetobacter pittii]|uniref:hypothetical protein n=2 Tax=Acinetobacter pittii TaxID=48296 RepID=UPI0019005CA2|nr:hypothetical protein [Acinetobacter pittii]MBJ8480453.1 hypothetical protein [Acinetobacter pittii]MCU4341855.1 hypothetical protein [Acinetobacter pittii]MCU4561301.1 hypothetical protein [Acinetobacter pittii]
MGIKVNKVRDKKNLYELTVNDCDQGYNSDYICRTENCNANMSFIKSHEKRLFDKVIKVPSFFKLKNGNKHSEFCPYDTQGAIEIICRNSDSNVLNSLNNKKFEFSLQILHNPKNENGESNTIDEAGNHGGDEKKLGKKYSSSGSLSNYINTLKQILVLRNKLEEDNNISEFLMLNYRGEKIKWNNFYFSEKNYIDAFTLGYLKKISYPICFEGVVKSIKEPTDNFKNYSIKFYSPHIESLEENITEIPVVEIILKPEDYDKINISNGSSLLVYGLSSFKPSSEPWVSKENKKYKFFNISLWIKTIHQIIVLDD